MGEVEQVKVEIGGKEEWWGLRIVNMLVGLSVLLETGKTVSSLCVIGE